MLIQLSSYPFASLSTHRVHPNAFLCVHPPRIPEVRRGWAGDHPRGRTVPWSEGEANGGEAAPPWGGPTDARDGAKSMDRNERNPWASMRSGCLSSDSYWPKCCFTCRWHVRQSFGETWRAKGKGLQKLNLCHQCRCFFIIKLANRNWWTTRLWWIWSNMMNHRNPIQRHCLVRNLCEGTCCSSKNLVRETGIEPKSIQGLKLYELWPELLTKRTAASKIARTVEVLWPNFPCRTGESPNPNWGC